MDDIKRKKAFITGITGQDGSYLLELLLAKGYEVHGLVRRTSTFNRGRIEHIFKDAQASQKTKLPLTLHYGDLTDGSNIARLLATIKPDEIYNLGAQSHVRISFDMPEYTINVVGLGALRILEAIRETGIKTKFYQASSSEMFGNVAPPQSELTPFSPASPYGIAKVAAFNFTKNYRDSYGLFATNGILFNHESPRRGENFVTHKVTAGVAEILAGKRDKIYLGNLNAKRDWGYAPEYVEAMWKMLQVDEPDDYVIATGETHSVAELAETAFKLGGISDWQKYIAIDPYYHRPVDIHHLIGDATKAKQKLGWEPKVKFGELVSIMLEANCKTHGVKLPSLFEKPSGVIIKTI